MFIIKFKKLASLLKRENLEESYRFAVEMLNKYPDKPEVYVAIAKICFKLGNLDECKKFLIKLTTLKNWYKDEIVKEILEITNWKLLYSNKYFCKEPKFSYDGENIVFVCAKKDTNNDGIINNYDCGGVYITDRNGEKINCIVEDKYYNLYPCFSPDGRFICFFSARKDTNNDGVIDYKDNFGLYLFDLTSGDEKLLIDNLYSPKHLEFSPDGKKVVFSCWLSPNSKSSIYEIEIKTLTLNNLVQVYESVSPTYSLDNKYLLYSSFRSESNEIIGGGPTYKSGIYMLDLDKHQEIEIAPPKYINSFPVFSHNSEKIAFLSKRRDTNNDGEINSLDNDGIYIFDLNEKKEYCVHTDKYFNKFVNFTYDDKYIVFLSTWHRRYKKDSSDYFEYKGIYICDVEGNKLRQIVSDKYYGCAWLNASPKRNEVVYTSFRKNTLRGLYLAYLFEFPKKDEIIDIIYKNL